MLLRRTRHGLASAAVAIALLACGSLRAGEAEDRAVKAIEKIGGQVWRDAKKVGKPVTRVELNNSKGTNAATKELKALKDLQSLDLRCSQVTDAGLMGLA